MEFTTNNNKKKYIVTGLIVLLAIAAIGFAALSVKQAQDIKKLQAQVAAEQTNGKVLNFLTMFVDKVLKTDKEVSFEDRLQLENAIRNINDPEILAKWEQFTNGKTVDEIQTGVKELLEALVKKIV